MTDPRLRRTKFYIDGQWAAPASAERMRVISPATELEVGEVPQATVQDMDRAVAAARRAFEEGPWPETPAAERAAWLEQLAAAMRARAADIAEVTVQEMGCAASQAQRAQTALVAPVFEYYANLCRTFAFERQVALGDRHGLVRELPVGVVGAIVPWNAPVTLAAWKLAPALAAGCTVVLKPAPEAPLSNYLLADAVHEVGLPAGVVNVVPGDRDVGERLVTHPDIDKVAFTGSTAAGKRIMALCAEQLKRVSLELGGKSAAVLLDDADFPEVLPRAVKAAMHLSGQFCGAQSRILVPRQRYAELVELAGRVAAGLTVGDPRDPQTLVGPVVSARQRATIEGLIRSAVEQGARVVTGGRRPAQLTRGWYIEPTVLADVQNTMRVAQDEIFGPVVCLIAHDGDDDAVRLANDSRYGLAGGVWSADDARAVAVARRIRTGSVSINGTPAPFPAVPFGGFKQSGIGRELGPEGLRSFLEPQSLGSPAAGVGL